MPWTLACLGWPLLLPFLLFAYAWVTLIGTSLVLGLGMAIVRLTRGKQPSEFTKRALVSALIQVVLVALFFLVWMLLKR